MLYVLSLHGILFLSPAGAIRAVVTLNLISPTSWRYTCCRYTESYFSHQLALYVLSFLEAKDLLRAAQTCRYWRLLAEDNLLWREKCREESIDEKLVFGGRLRRRQLSGGTGGGAGSKSPWKHLYLRQKQIEFNWKAGPLRPPKVLFVDPFCLVFLDPEMYFLLNPSV